MTPTALKNLRQALALNQTQMAAAIGLEGPHAWRFLADLESGKRPITGPIARVCEYMAREAGIPLQPTTQDGTSPPIADGGTAPD